MSKADELKKKVQDRFGLSASDSGSAVVQIALLTARIDNLSSHSSKNKQDKHSLLGLYKMVAQRRRLLKYVNRTNPAQYSAVLQELNLRG